MLARVGRIKFIIEDIIIIHDKTAEDKKKEIGELRKRKLEDIRGRIKEISNSTNIDSCI